MINSSFEWEKIVNGETKYIIVILSIVRISSLLQDISPILVTITLSTLNMPEPEQQFLLRAYGLYLAHYLINHLTKTREVKIIPQWEKFAGFDFSPVIEASLSNGVAPFIDVHLCFFRNLSLSLIDFGHSHVLEWELQQVKKEVDHKMSTLYIVQLFRVLLFLFLVLIDELFMRELDVVIKDWVIDISVAWSAN